MIIRPTRVTRVLCVCALFSFASPGQTSGVAETRAPSYSDSNVANLAETVKGVLLLTATPQQLCSDGHGARLKLLDPDRYVETFAKLGCNILTVHY